MEKLDIRPLWGIMWWVVSFLFLVVLYWWSGSHSFSGLSDNPRNSLGTFSWDLRASHMLIGWKGFAKKERSYLWYEFRCSKFSRSAKFPIHRLTSPTARAPRTKILHQRRTPTPSYEGIDYHQPIHRFVASAIVSVSVSVLVSVPALALGSCDEAPKIWIS